MNIASNEDSGIDVTGYWIDKDQLNVNFRFNSDDKDDIKIDYIFNINDITLLRDLLTDYITSQPKE